MQMEMTRKWLTIFISDKVDFKTKAIKKDKGHYIMIKGSVQEEDFTLINIYVCTYCRSTQIHKY